MSVDNILVNNAGNIVFNRSLTHNMLEMATHAGLYDAVWRPDNISATIALHLIEPLTMGLIELTVNKKIHETYTHPKGGNIDMITKHVAMYLRACRENPTAKIVISR